MPPKSRLLLFCAFHNHSPSGPKASMKACNVVCGVLPRYPFCTLQCTIQASFASPPIKTRALPSKHADFLRIHVIRDFMSSVMQSHLLRDFHAISGCAQHLLLRYTPCLWAASRRHPEYPHLIHDQKGPWICGQCSPSLDMLDMLFGARARGIPRLQQYT